MTGLTAPTFFFAAGLIFTYLLLKQSNPSERLGKGWRRGLWLMLLGFVLQLNLSRLVQSVAGRLEDGVWLKFLTHSHVLQAIGLSLIALVGLYYLSQWTKIPLLVSTLILANVSFVFCPFTKVYDSGEGVGFLLELFFSRERSAFPLFPWLGFALFGCVAGIATVRWRWFENVRVLIVLFLTGILLSHALAYPMLYLCYLPFCDDPSTWIQSSIGTYYRLGEVLMLTALMAALCKWVRMPRFLLASGSETLTVYFLHVILLYGGLFGYGLKSLVSHELGGWQTAAVALSVVGSFAILALNLPKLRDRWPWLGLLR